LKFELVAAKVSPSSSNSSRSRKIHPIPHSSIHLPIYQQLNAPLVGVWFYWSVNKLQIQTSYGGTEK
jgi:hypothetical protein